MGAQPFALPGSHCLKEDCVGLHTKYIIWLAYRLASCSDWVWRFCLPTESFYYTLWGCITSCPGTQIGHACSKVLITKKKRSRFRRITGKCSSYTNRKGHQHQTYESSLERKWKHLADQDKPIKLTGVELDWMETTKESKDQTGK